MSILTREEIIKESGFVSLHLDDHTEELYSTIFLRIDTKGEEAVIYMDTVIPEEGNDGVVNASGINLLENGDINDVEWGYRPGWDEKLNGMLRPADTGWSVGYHGTVSSPEIGYHAHVVDDCGDDGGFCFEFIDYNCRDFGIQCINRPSVIDNRLMAFNQVLAVIHCLICFVSLN